MLRTWLAVFTAAPLIACGGSNTSDPLSVCKNYGSTYCNKFFQCDPSDAAQQYANAGACASTISEGCNATNFGCPSGKTLNLAAAATCTNGIDNASCTDFNADRWTENCTVSAQCQ